MAALDAAIARTRSSVSNFQIPLAVSLVGKKREEKKKTRNGQGPTDRAGKSCAEGFLGGGRMTHVWKTPS